VHGHYDEPWQHFFSLLDLPGFGEGENEEVYAQSLYQGAAGMGFGGQGDERDEGTGGGPSGSASARGQGGGMEEERRYYY